MCFCGITGISFNIFLVQQPAAEIIILALISDISFNESLSKDFIKNLSLKLNEWTGKRWMITLSKEEGETSIYETKNQLKEEIFKDIKQTEAYKKVLEAFPDAELIDVQEENQK